MSAIVINAPAGETLPRTVKIFANPGVMGFEDAEDAKPTHVISLTEENLGKEITLPFVRFQFIASLAIFVEDNHGDDITKLSGLSFIGAPCAEMNMAEFKRQGG
eukprot:g3111.t1